MDDRQLTGRRVRRTVRRLLIDYHHRYCPVCNTMATVSPVPRRWGIMARGWPGSFRLQTSEQRLNVDIDS
jgi:hypothetical protein